MKFGYILENYGEILNGKGVQSLIETAKYAEQVNYTSIWSTDHILQARGSFRPQYDNITEAITTISFLAGITTRVKLGISALILPLRNPIVAIKQLVTLHYLTHGRVEIAFGAGWHEKEFGFLNQQFKNRGKRFDEGLRLILNLIGGKDSFAGEFFQFTDASFLPNPSLSLPMYVAGNSKHALKRAIKFGLGWHPTSMSASNISEIVNIVDNTNEIEIIVRLRTTPDVKDLSTIIQSYNDIGVKHILLDIPGGLEPLKRVTKIIQSFL